MEGARQLRASGWDETLKVSTQMGGHRANGPAPAPGSEVLMRSSSSQTRRGTTGIRKRHARTCPTFSDRNARCRCRPSYEAAVYLKREDTKLRKSFPTEAAAKAWRADMLVSVRRGKVVTASNETLRDTKEWFMEGARSGVILSRNDLPYKPSTLRGYERNLEKHVLPDLGALKLGEVRRSDLQGLVDRLMAAGSPGSTVRNIITPVETIFRLAVQDDKVAVNPATNLRLPKPGKPRDRVASPQEAALLISLLPEGDQALWATYFYEGLRRGEARSLRVDDIDFDSGVIRVVTGWDDVEGEVDPKSEKGTREVPLILQARAYLHGHLRRTGRSGRDLVFGRTASVPFSPTLMRERALRAWGLAALGAFLTGEPLPVEIAPICPHECRHTFVSLMAASGVPLERIGDYVGHSTTYMTDRYRHLLPGQRKADAAALDALLHRAM
jgi:integrase